MRKVRGAALAVLAPCLTACYHAVVDTGRAPASTVITKPWTNTFVFGLVPAAEIDTATECPTGVARVETRQSLLNGLAGVLTFGLYTPQEVRITCAAAATGVLPADRTLDVGPDASRGHKAAVVNEAIARATASGAAIYVQF